MVTTRQQSKPLYSLICLHLCFKTIPFLVQLKAQTKLSNLFQNTTIKTVKNIYSFICISICLHVCMHACRYLCTYVYHVHAVLMEAK